MRKLLIPARASVSMSAPVPYAAFGHPGLVGPETGADLDGNRQGRLEGP